MGCRRRSAESLLFAKWAGASLWESSTLKTKLTNLFDIPVDDLWKVPVAEARRQLGIPGSGVAPDLYRDMAISAEMAKALREEWSAFDVSR